MGWMESLAIEGSGIIGKWLSIANLFPRADPVGIIQKDDLSLTSWEGLLCAMVAPWQGGARNCREVGSSSLQEEKHRIESKVSFLLETQLLFCQSG